MERIQSKKQKASRVKTMLLTSMVLPGAIWFFFLRYLPMGGIILAFKNYKVYTKKPTFWNNLIHSKWVGFKNFSTFIHSFYFGELMRNTILYSLAKLCVSVPLSIILSVRGPSAIVLVISVVPSIY